MHFGFIAQNIEEVLPSIVHKTGEGYKTLSYTEVIPFSIKAIQEQQDQIENLKNLISLNSEGDVILEKPVDQYTYNSSLNYQNQVSNLKSKLYNLKTITGDTITRISGFAKVITANIKAGLIETENLIVNNALLTKSIVAENLHLTTDNLTIAGKKLSDYIDERISNYLANQRVINTSDNFISPVVETGQLNLTNKDSKIRTTTENSKIQITDTNNQTVAEFNTDEKKTTITGDLKLKSDTNKGKLSQLILNNFDGKNTVVIDGNGNASFSGTITAKEVQTDTLKAKKIEAENIQTQINQIEQRLNQIISNDNNNQSTNEDDKPLYERINEIQQLLADVNNSSLPDVGYYQKLNPELKADFINTNYLNAKNTITTTNLIALNSLAVNNIYIEQNKIMTINEELNLTAEKRIVFFDNQVAISKNGDITTTGVIIAKGIKTESLESKPDQNLTIKLNGNENKLSIKNSQDQEVASIDNQGSAKFNEIRLEKYIPASDSANFILADTIDPLSTESAQILTENQTAGIGIIPENSQTVRIYSNKANSNSLIYLTPNSAELKGQLTVSKQEEGYFEVYITEKNNKEVKFNWLIIN
ncbi:MAG: hypothetical protein KatS3mg090_0639 [Patescibacteria group bacterium]|nr:MAG: hypothetical protein KatS3mg090_0639 [Patescibacteria group bacterium]